MNNTITRRESFAAIAAAIVGPHVLRVEAFGTFELAPSRPWANDDTTWNELASMLADWQTGAPPHEQRGCGAWNPTTSLLWGTPSDPRPAGALGHGWSTDRKVWVAFVNAPKQTVLQTLTKG